MPHSSSCIQLQTKAVIKGETDWGSSDSVLVAIFGFRASEEFLDENLLFTSSRFLASLFLDPMVKPQVISHPSTAVDRNNRAGFDTATVFREATSLSLG